MREEDTVCVGSDGLKYCKVCGEAKEAFFPKGGFMAVSYTHLDVYKRQPLDGVVLDGDSMLDTSALTGESVPRSVHKGDEALSLWKIHAGQPDSKTL